jgi:diaminohydroxyphosphoribosylaminopyrimidine deaminase/5-amino-6-(5-phosphoribosylamino)uracil reductase
MNHYNDYSWMIQAIIEGEKGRWIAPPNPSVGCILVKNNIEIARGHTLEPGHGHAETVALQRAGSDAIGATAYVTLEPCSHFGKTPPCANALIAAGVKRVVIGTVDPDPRVSTNGIHLLRQAGIEVDTGIAEKEVTKSLRAYIHQRSTGRPFIVAKIAITLDGRIAAVDHSSQWISCPEAREDVHFTRSLSQAIVIGSGTALKDQPSLTVRGPHQSKNPPLRVILDSRGNVPAIGPLFDPSLAPTLVITTHQGAKIRRNEWDRAGAEVIVIQEDPTTQSIDLQIVMKELAKRGVLQVLVEGGATLHQSLFESNLVDRMDVYIGPKVVGPRGIPALFGADAGTIEQANQFRLIDHNRFGHTIRCRYDVYRTH